MDSPLPPPTSSVEEATAAMDISADENDNDPAPTSAEPPQLEEQRGGEAVASDSSKKDEAAAAAASADLSSTSSSEGEMEDEEEDGGISPEKAELLLIKATGLKEEGNNDFKNGELEKAARCYRRAVASLKKLNKNNTGDDQVKALLLTLHTNLSMVSFKQQKYRVAVELAGRAIQIDQTNVKALYRRAVANRKLGNLEASRTDLRIAIQRDGTNTACKKELVAVKKEIEVSKTNQKKALAKAFTGSGGSSFLYNDKESAEKKRQEEQRRNKLAQEELLKKRKAQWEDECVSRMAKNEPAITYEDWDKERMEKEEQEQKQKEEERKQAEKRRQEEQRAAKKAAAAAKAAANNNNDSDDDDDDELTPAELASLRGYKQTADGRTTSYFTRELSEDERKRIGDIAPKRLDNNSNTSNSNASAPVPLSSSGGNTTTTAPSAWNQAGTTWEEKDTTTWCTAKLRQHLQETSVATEDRYDVHVTAVDELTGDASVALAGQKKKRYIFDFHVKLKYEIKQVEEDDTVVGSGVVRLPDICSGSHDAVEVNFESWSNTTTAAAVSAIKQPDKETMGALRASLTDELRKNVQLFVQDFNDQY